MVDVEPLHRLACFPARQSAGSDAWVHDVPLLRRMLLSARTNAARVIPSRNVHFADQLSRSGCKFASMQQVRRRLRVFGSTPMMMRGSPLRMETFTLASLRKPPPPPRRWVDDPPPDVLHLARKELCRQIWTHAREMRASGQTQWALIEMYHRLYDAMLDEYGRIP